MIESKVGYATTTILQKFLEDYIRAFTHNHRYTGDVEYLFKYNDLRRYNEHQLF